MVHGRSSQGKQVLKQKGISGKQVRLQHDSTMSHPGVADALHGLAPSKDIWGVLKNVRGLRITGGGGSVQQLLRMPQNHEATPQTWFL